MTRYQLRADDDTIIGEGSFDSDDEAYSCSLEDAHAAGWTLLRREGGRWVMVRRHRDRSLAVSGASARR